MATKLEAKTYTQDGKDAGAISLPERVFGAKWNADLVHQVVTAMQGNARNRTAHTKDRSEVRGGGKKPWRQKGTGRARHGSRRSPIWKGGGVTFGPRNERDFTRKLNKKVRANALATVLSKKFNDGEVVFVDKFSFEAPKTKDARAVLEAFSKVKGHEDIATKEQNTALVALTKRDVNVEKSFRNLEQVHVLQVKDMNPVELLTYKYLIVAEPKEAVKTLEARISKDIKTETKATTKKVTKKTVTKKA
jgi:large subunit ribosomal protein L4